MSASNLVGGHAQAKDLLCLIGTCVDMRSQASADLHWERLTRGDFSGNLTPGDEADARRWGWMRIYRMKQLEREAARWPFPSCAVHYSAASWQTHWQLALLKCCDASCESLCGRCRQQAEDARRLERRRRPFTPFMPFGGGPFARRPRAGSYHQIGGDYDRNPLFQGTHPGWRPFLGSSGGGFGSGFRTV